jgi:hypothetical protein
MRSRNPKLPTSPVFWREFLEEDPELHGGMDDDACSDTIGSIINMRLGSAEEAAAVVYFMTRGLDDERSVSLATSAAERWLELMDVAAADNGSAAATTITRRYRYDWNAARVNLRW